MLKLIIAATEQYNEITGEFVNSKEQTLQLEHSLVSLSKWESKWKKPFLSTRDLTAEEIIDYIKCMTITQNVDPNIYINMTANTIKTIFDYINDEMTATTINDRKGRINRDIITSELIYYWMITLGIPFECQKWHLNRLLTLIKVCNIKSGPKKKMRGSDIVKQNAALNAVRRRKSGSKG